MKKFLLISNITLIIAVVYIYYMHFSYINNDAHKIEHANAAAANSFKIAYFDLDSLDENYEYFKEVRTYLTSRQDAINAQLNKMREEYSNKINEFNKRGTTLSQAEQTEFQQQIAKMQK